MSTITAILQPEADGSVRLPLPLELRHRTLKVTATLEPISSARPTFGCLAGKIELSPDFDEPLEDFKEYME
jgi:hypothetical protein